MNVIWKGRLAYGPLKTCLKRLICHRDKIIGKLYSWNKTDEQVDIPDPLIVLLQEKNVHSSSSKSLTLFIHLKTTLREGDAGI